MKRSLPIIFCILVFVVVIISIFAFFPLIASNNLNVNLVETTNEKDSEKNGLLDKQFDYTETSTDCIEETTTEGSYNLITPIYLKNQNYSDVSKIYVGMSANDLWDNLVEDSYVACFGSGFYVNDLETNHIFNIKININEPLKNWKVISIVDTGISIDYIAPVESLELLYLNMPFEEIVSILGKPLGCPSSGVIRVAWKIMDDNHMVLLSFRDGAAMIYTGHSDPIEISTTQN